MIAHAARKLMNHPRPYSSRLFGDLITSIDGRRPNYLVVLMEKAPTIKGAREVKGGQRCFDGLVRSQLYTMCTLVPLLFLESNQVVQLEFTLH